MEIVCVDMKAYLEPLILIIAIVLGALTGLIFSLNSTLVDYLIIVMLCCLFFNVSMGPLLKGVKNISLSYISVIFSAYDEIFRCD